ncbi:Hypothetical protein POVR1_LOCUS488 [uncultured virus]|nr:Hypothetical protein POVR1_LOCUS488 [uncultured virus]
MLSQTRHSEHIKVIQCLLDGINPVTMEPIPKDHLINDPVVIRALHHVVTGYLQKSPSEAPEKPRKQRVIKPWTPEEHLQVINLHAEGNTIESIAQVVGRPKKAIANRIRRHEKFEAKPNLLNEAKVKRDNSSDALESHNRGPRNAPTEPEELTNRRDNSSDALESHNRGPRNARGGRA